MRFYTKQECEEWLTRHGRRKPDAVPELRRERIDYPAERHKMRFVTHWIATSLTYEMRALLWITEWDIWPGSENWHLYYKLRQTYHDHRLLDEAPGHLFLEHEAEDLASFLQLSMLNGWGGYLLTQADYVNMFFSHDEYMDFFADRDENLSDVRTTLAPKKPAGT